jgi:hypothetical protein
MAQQRHSSSAALGCCGTLQLDLVEKLLKMQKLQLICCRQCQCRVAECRVPGHYSTVLCCCTTVGAVALMCGSAADGSAARRRTCHHAVVRPVFASPSLPVALQSWTAVP